MKIIILTGIFKESADGVARSLYRLSDSLSREGMQHWVFSPVIEASDSSCQHVEEVSSIPLPGYRDYRVAIPLSGIKKRFDAIQPDLIHISTPDFLGLFGLLYARKRGVPVVGAYHTHFPSYMKYVHLGFLEKPVWRFLEWFYGRADAVLAPTKAVCRLLESRGIGKVTLWHRGIESSLFHPRRRDVELRKKWGDPHYFYAIFAGRLVWYKDLQVVREVYHRIQKEERPIRFVLAGEGPAAKELRSTMPEAIFVGYVDKQEMGRYLASSDVLFFPSTTETFGQVVTEGFACGIPAIVSDQGGPAELVYESKGGVVVKAGEVELFAQALRRFSEDKEIYRSSQQKALAYAADRDWHEVNRSVLEVYSKLGSKRPIDDAQPLQGTAGR